MYEGSGLAQSETKRDIPNMAPYVSKNERVLCAPMLCTMHVSVLLAEGAWPRVKALLTETGDSQSFAPMMWLWSAQELSELWESVPSVAASTYVAAAVSEAVATRQWCLVRV